MASTKELLARDIARAVGAGRPVSLDTVDFNDPNRPLTCLEVDFPLLPVNEIAKVESSSGAGRKPIYTMSKWWARRPSSVFRSLLIAAATKAPEDRALSARSVWDVYYNNHQQKENFSGIKVADIFMGGGTTLIEGARLGFDMVGNDLNPVAWFVVKNEITSVTSDAVQSLLDDVEVEVKPQIAPYIACSGPLGEQGHWIHKPTGHIEDSEFDPLSLTVEQRREYRYEGPEIIYTFWSKHGPCQVTGCGHRTPIMNSPVVAVKTLSVKHWQRICSECAREFHVEENDARVAPDVPLYVAPSEHPFSVIDRERGVVCPFCGHAEIVNLGKGKNKKVELTLLVHPKWLAGSSKDDARGNSFGGSAQDDAVSTARWDQERASKISLLEVRGVLPDEVTCPATEITFKTTYATVPKRSNFTCGACGTGQDVLASVRATSKTGPMAGYAVQAYSPRRDSIGSAYNGRFFAPFDLKLARQYDAAVAEWEDRKLTDLANYFPDGYTHWWTMFNPRQLLILSQLLKAIMTSGGDNHTQEVREYVLGAFHRYLQHQNMMCFWDIQQDCVAPSLSNANFHPKSSVVENSVFSTLGRGNWRSSIANLFETIEWSRNPWELVSNQRLIAIDPAFADKVSGKSEKAFLGDKIQTPPQIACTSSTDLQDVPTGSIDLVITDPPFGGLLHYAELADFFYVWLRLALKNHYPEIFTPELTPKVLEVVANKAREPEDSDGFYQRLLTQCWREAHRILKPGGILAFTFHHSEDKPLRDFLMSKAKEYM
jgi:putative DNA methylase